MRAAHPRTCRDSASAGFTLIEVVAVVVILLAMATIAVPVLLQQKARADNAATEASVVGIARAIIIGIGIGTVNEASPIAGPTTLLVGTGTGSITVPGGYAVTYDSAAGHYCVQGQQGDSDIWQASSDSGAPLQVSPGTCTDDGLGIPADPNGQDAQASATPAATTEPAMAPSASSPATEAPAHTATADPSATATADPVPTASPSPTVSADPDPTATPTPTATTAPVALTFANDTTAVSTVGSYVDTTNGTTITVTPTSAEVKMTANWEWITVTYGPRTDTIYKTRGVDAIGVLTRVSNSDVTIALPSTQPYTLVIKYNGKSAGTIYEVLTAA